MMCLQHGILVQNTLYQKILMNPQKKKYFGKNYLLGRAYLGRNNIDRINAFELLYRRFGKKPRTYLEAKVGFGNSPDEAYLESSLVNVSNNRSRFALLGYSHQFNHRWYARIWGIYDRQLPDRVNADFNIISGYLGVWWNF